jgi:hypothetical protein
MTGKPSKAWQQPLPVQQMAFETFSRREHNTLDWLVMVSTGNSSMKASKWNNNASQRFHHQETCNLGHMDRRSQRQPIFSTGSSVQKHDRTQPSMEIEDPTGRNINDCQ